MQPIKNKAKKNNATGLKKIAPTASASIKKAKKNVKSALSGIKFETQAVEDVVKAITLPINSLPQRYSSEYSSLPTAVANPWSLQSAPSVGNAVQTQVNYEGMPTTDGLAAVFRSAQRAAVIYDPNPTSQTQLYDMQGVQNAVTPSAPAGTWRQNTALANTRYFAKTPIATTRNIANYSPHGPVVYAGEDGKTDGRYFWLDITNVNVTIAPSNTGESITSSLSLWNSDGVNPDVVSVTTVSGGIPFGQVLPVTVPGYYCLSHSSSLAGDHFNVTVNWTGSSAVFKHLSLSNLPNNFGSTDGIRISAVSMMYSNEASPLNKQGKVCGFQEPQGVHWNDFIGSFSTFSSQQGSTTMPIENGLYGFLKPTQPEDFDLIDHSIIENGVVYDSFYPLDQKSAFLMIYWQITALPGQDGYWTICHGIEYQTNDVWRPVDDSHLDGQTYSMALESIKTFPQWYENPLHWSDIWERIKSVSSSIASGIVKYGPTVLKGATMVAAAL
jgi:hypothetical protein